jgi:YVTN family beta-propeller protein
LTPDESELWVSAELSGEIYIIDLPSYEILDVIKFLPPGFREVDVTPVDLVISKDGATAFVTLGRANHIAYVDVVTREIVDYVLVGSRAWGLALSRDETKMFVTNGLSDDVTIVDVARRRALKSVPVGRVPYGVRIDD